MIAALLRELLAAERAPAAQRYVDAATVAQLFGVERDWVYAHKDELGAVRLGGGRRARLRFDVKLVAAALEHRNRSEPSSSRRLPTLPRPRRGAGRPDIGVELIPYEA